MTGEDVADVIADVSNAQLVAYVVGRSVDQLFPGREAAGTADVVLDVKDFTAPPVVKQASFTLRRGEVLGIAGLMGSGAPSSSARSAGWRPSRPVLSASRVPRPC